MDQDLDGRVGLGVSLRLAVFSRDIVLASHGLISFRDDVCIIHANVGKVERELDSIKVRLQGRNIKDSLSCVDVDRYSDIGADFSCRSYAQKGKKSDGRHDQGILEKGKSDGQNCSCGGVLTRYLSLTENHQVTLTEESVDVTE